MNRVVHEIHVSAAFVDGGHQALLVCSGPIDGVEVGIVHGVVMGLTC